MLVNLCLLACTKTEIENVVRQVEPEKPSAIYYYCFYEPGEIISSEKLGYIVGTFTSGCTFVYGDTLFMANTQIGNYNVDLYSQGLMALIHIKWL